MPVVTPEHLRELQAHLKHYVDPENRDGFFRTFVIWVIKTWTAAEFYDTEIRDQGYDCSPFPVKTGEPLSEHCIYYRDFFNANTGETEPTFESGSGMRCEEIGSRLEEIYGEACTQKLIAYVKQHGLTLPEDVQDEYVNTVDEAIFAEAFDRKTMPELHEVAEDIMWGIFGAEQRPYEVERIGPDPEDIQDNYFGSWTLKDFKKAMVV